MVRSAANSGKSLVDRLRACQRSNKRCADCLERVPTYVCLDFHTFVCQTCSGIHREFGHKLKSISLSEWTACEVERVEAGGNERAAQEWMGRSKGQEEVVEPDGTDLGLLREFIRLKYREQRWRAPEPSAGKSGPAQPALPGPAAAPAGPPEVQPAPPGPPAAPANPCEVARPPPIQVARPPPIQALPTVQPPLTLQMDLGDLLSGDLLSGEPLDLQPIQPHVPAAPRPVHSTADCCKAPVAEEFSAQWIPDFGCLGDCDKTLDGSEVSTADSNPSDNEAPASPQRQQDGGSSTTGTELLAGEPAEPAEEPQPCSEGLEGQAGSLAERLREAVLRGSGDEIKQLFQKCLEPKVPPKREISPSHYSAFDDLISATPECSQTTDAPAVQPPQPAVPPFSTGTGTPTSAVPPPREPPTPQQEEELAPRRDGAFTPQQLAHMSPKEMVRVQGMIEHALKTRVQPMPWPVAGSLQDDSESSLDEQTPFGDLLLEFHQRNPIAGFKTRS